jgi:hypothetical protein
MRLNGMQVTFPSFTGFNSIDLYHETSHALLTLI